MKRPFPVQSTADQIEAPVGLACAMKNRTILCRCLVDFITNGTFGLAFNAASTRKHVSFQMPVRRPGGHWELLAELQPVRHERPSEIGQSAVRP